MIGTKRKWGKSIKIDVSKAFAPKLLPIYMTKENWMRYRKMIKTYKEIEKIIKSEIKGNISRNKALSEIKVLLKQA